MGGFLSAGSLILSIAARQHGVVRRDQLLAAGISRRQLDRRLEDGRLKPLHRGVYLVGAIPSEFAYPQAALFACGPQSALGCRSALSIWQLLRYPPLAPPWVTVPPKRRIERRGVVITRSRLEDEDVRWKHGMRVASPPRALLDLAAFAPDICELESLVAEAHYRRLAGEDELRHQLQRNRGRPGTRLLREILDRPGGPQRTRSGGERWFLQLLREYGIDGFEVNAKVHGWEVDFFWREHGLCIELDGWDGHSSRAAFEKDRRKWADLSARGLTVVPVAVRDARRNQGDTVRLVTRLLGHTFKQVG